ncbi:ABC transporter substrate-binding protein [Spiroplasma sp. SV19]|uniref:ABC transporter substrate-binding protein n=1 Tax=Spiroplasma sp. SV19 TaxID=2570468 RepID=UPI0024B70116|nr:ABC transporter substrate-binding protein [Spiroplasma sp. SV19]WHQ36540.1 oligopeptide ABC transporter substrate-binding lipoprotein [Spiroplasma sp. SV19]
MLKKKLALFASLTTITTVTPLVVSCGISLDRLANRLNYDNVFRSIFKFPLTSWSNGTTIQGEDNKILADLVGTLVATDKYNRSFGDIAVQADKTSKYVGQPNADQSEWKYKISPQAKWFDYRGNFQRQIKASDMINTAKFVLFPKNLSSTAGIWRTFIAGAQEIWEHFQTGSYKPDYYNDPIWSKLGMSVNSADDEITIKLTKSAEYFDTLMTYLAFAPMPEKAVLQGYNYGTNFKNIWYSGAYLVEKYGSTSQILLRKNPEYRYAKLTYIDKLNYTYLANNDVSRERVLFESGDVNDFIVQPTDTNGWGKYVGPNPANPTFSGASSIINPDPITFTITFNYANTDILKNNNSLAKQALNASKALQYDKLRKYLVTHLDRSKFVKYYSEALDDSPTSKFLRNVYTARYFIKNGNVDYANYVEAEYANKYLNGDVQASSQLLKDGSDALYLNQDLLKNDKNILDEIRAWLQQNIGSSSVELRFLMNGAGTLTNNRFLLNMIDSFNAENNVIKIIPDITVDATEYISRTKKADWDIFVGGWSPDYVDPYSYLHTFSLGGDLQYYSGTSRIFSDLKLENNRAPEFADIVNKLNNPYWNHLKSTNAIESFYNIFKNYTNQIADADHITDPKLLTKRYESFAKAEFNSIYTDFMFIPTYVPNGSYQIRISYVTPRTQITVGYGSSKYKHWGMELNPYLLTKRERQIIETRYQQQLAIIQTDYAAFREDY